MKKILAMLLVLVLTLGLVACGGGAASSAAEAPAESKEEAPAEEKEEEKEEPAEEAPAEEEASEEETAEEPAEEAPAEAGDAITVVYRCSVGAYVNVLQDMIAKYNEGQGKEDGVYIDFQSDINEYSSNLDKLMQAGTHFDIFDGGTNKDWLAQGYIKSIDSILEETHDPDLQALVDSYEPYIIDGVMRVNGELICLPLEVLPIKLAVNKDLFEQNNLEYPKTLSEMVNCAKVITENGGGDVFGYGWTTWSVAFRRLACKATMSSTGVGWFNNKENKYDFTPFKPIVDAMTEMYQGGYILGADDLAIDPIRAEFSAGRVGMFPAPAYDVSVYTNQFPAECNWEIIDMPLYDDIETSYKGVYLTRVNCVIDAKCWDEADDAKKAAILKAFLFINSDEMNAEIYANGGMIPYKEDLIKNTPLKVDIPQWAQMADITNYGPINLFPDALLMLEGDNFDVVFSEIMHGDAEWDDVIDDLNERYNAAWEEVQQDPPMDLSMYQYDYSLDK